MDPFEPWPLAEVLQTCKHTQVPSAQDQAATNPLRCLELDPDSGEIQVVPHDEDVPYVAISYC